MEWTGRTRNDGGNRRPAGANRWNGSQPGGGTYRRELWRRGCFATRRKTTRSRRGIRAGSAASLLDQRTWRPHQTRWLTPSASWAHLPVRCGCFVPWRRRQAPVSCDVLAMTRLLPAFDVVDTCTGFVLYPIVLLEPRKTKK
ncbi:hypothetical protein BS78_08G020800 [Paspalum vaginatum]|nr:hypothetical protein BS78_08G020800 [Paspalum vaginatum]